MAYLAENVKKLAKVAKQQNFAQSGRTDNIPETCQKDDCCVGQVSNGQMVFV